MVVGFAYRACHVLGEHSPHLPRSLRAVSFTLSDAPRAQDNLSKLHIVLSA